MTVDEHKKINLRVGKNLRLFREVAGLHQADLAGRIGCSYQQIQKYENGTNRISASRLFYACEALGILMSGFFDPEVSKDNAEQYFIKDTEFAKTVCELNRLQKLYLSLAAIGISRKFLEIVESLCTLREGLDNPSQNLVSDKSHAIKGV